MIEQPAAVLLVADDAVVSVMDGGEHDRIVSQCPFPAVGGIQFHQNAMGAFVGRVDAGESNVSFFGVGGVGIFEHVVEQRPAG